MDPNMRTNRRRTLVPAADIDDAMTMHSMKLRRGTPVGGRARGGALLAAALLCTSACGGSEADGAVQEGSEPFVRVVNVETAVVEPTTFQEEIRLTGTIQANRDVVVSAEESGPVTEVVEEKGSSVRAGQPLLRIDDTLLRSQVEEARAQAELAQETWERRRRLWEEDRVGSELAYLEARFASRQASARLATLEERLERTVVRAPIDGVLDERRVELGTLVSPGTQVARIVQLDPVKVAAGVPERFAADVSPGTPATVRFDVLAGESFEGEVSYVGAAVDPRSRTFPVEVVVPNPGGVIKPEMVATIGLLRRRLEGAVVVPQDALVRIADGYRAFVVQGEGDETVARAVDVTPGPSQNNRVVVEEGLEAGDRLVVVGQQQLAEGDRVRVVTGGGR
jgi:RND family efflux transporter MFP subunit